MFLTIILAITVFAFTQKAKVRDFTYRIQLFFYQLDNFWQSFKETVQDVKGGLGALKEYNRRFGIIIEGETERGE